jgi:hypothetical protein
MGGDFPRRVAIYSLATSPVTDGRKLPDLVSSSKEVPMAHKPALSTSAAVYRAGKGGVLRRKKTDINHE